MTVAKKGSKYSFALQDIPSDLPQVLTKKLRKNNHTEFLLQLLRQDRAQFIEELETMQWEKAERTFTMRAQPLLRAIRRQKQSWRDIAKPVQQAATDLVRALKPGTAVRWFVPDPSMPTSLAYYDKERRRWEVRMHINTLIHENFLSEEQIDPNPLTMQATLGQAIHELAHTMHSTQDRPGWLPNYEQQIMANSFEDDYVNARILSRLPGAENTLRIHNNWCMATEDSIDHLNKAWKANSGFTTFEEWANFMGHIFHVAVSTHQAPEITLPSDQAVDFFNEMKPLFDRLVEERLTLDERATILQELADVITRHYRPKLHENPEIKWTHNKNGGTETKMSQETLGSPLTDLLKDYLGCLNDQQQSKQAPNPELTQILANLNAESQASEDEHLENIEGLNYTNATPSGRAPTPNVDPNLVDELRKIFRTRYTERRNWVHGTPEGKLSMRRVHKLLRKNPGRDVFKRRKTLDTVNTAVLILVDASGSMSGIPYHGAVDSAETLAQALAGNSDYKLHVWTYSGGAAQVDVAGVKPNNNGIRVWPELWGGGTPSFLALAKAHQFLRNNHPNAHRIILHFTDAAPGSEGEGDAEMQALIADENTSHASIAVLPKQYRNSIPVLQQRHPTLNLMDHDTEDIIQAISEFVLEHGA